MEVIPTCLYVCLEYYFSYACYKLNLLKSLCTEYRTYDPDM
jgi:hypothetical protein